MVELKALLLARLSQAIACTRRSRNRLDSQLVSADVLLTIHDPVHFHVVYNT